MRARREAKRKQRMAKWFGPFVGGEEIITTMTMMPDGHLNPMNVGTALGGLAGIAFDTNSNKSARDKSLRMTKDASTSAGRFPRVATTLILTPTRLVTTDVHHVTSKPSLVMAQYSLADIDRIEMVSRIAAVLTFADESHVRLTPPSGVGKYAKPFQAAFAKVLIDYTKQSATAP